MNGNNFIRNVSTAALYKKIDMGGDMAYGIEIKRRDSRFKAKYRKGKYIVARETAELSDYRYILKDYRTGETIKKKVMNVRKAHELNQLLKGSGIAWARC